MNSDLNNYGHIYRFGLYVVCVLRGTAYFSRRDLVWPRARYITQPSPHLFGQICICFGTNYNSRIDNLCYNPFKMQMPGVQTNFYNADGQVLRLSAMKRVTTSNLDCKATTIHIIFLHVHSP